MAKCFICGKEMLEADGCACGKYRIGGKLYDRIRVGAPGGLDFGWAQDGYDSFRCHDCGAKLGELHHPGCDMEACPKCGEQLISCLCEDIRAVLPSGREVRI